MTEVNVAEFRTQLPAWLERAASGEDIVITRRGKALARLGPLEDKRRDARRFFDALRAEAVVGDVLSPIEEDWEADHGPL